MGYYDYILYGPSGYEIYVVNVWPTVKFTQLTDTTSTRGRPRWLVARTASCSHSAAAETAATSTSSSFERERDGNQQITGNRR